MVSKIIKKKEILQYFETVVVLLLLAFGIGSILRDTEAYYETIRSYYLWRGLFSLFLGLLLLAKINLKNKWILILCGLSFVGLICYLVYLRAGIDIWKWYGLQGASYIIIEATLIDLISQKELLKKLQSINWIAFGFFVAVMLFLSILKRGSYSTVLPITLIIAFIIWSDNSQKWKRMVSFLLWAYIIAACEIMIQSLVSIPYIGNRYYGIFGNHGMFGAGMSGSIICLVILTYWNREDKRRIYRKTEFAFLMFLTGIFTVFVFLISSRMSLLGMIISLYMMFVAIACQRKKWKWVLIVSATFCVLAGAFIGTLYFMQKIPEGRYDKIQITFIKSNLIYWRTKGEWLFMKDSLTGFFKGGSLINSLDAFSSYRLTIGLKYFENMNLWGHDSLWLFPDDWVEVSHPHNTYIAWLYIYGIIGGLLYLSIFFVGLIKSFIRFIKWNKSFDMLLWGSYLLGILLTDVFLNTSIEMIMFFILICPILRKVENE